MPKGSLRSLLRTYSMIVDFFFPRTSPNREAQSIMRSYHYGVSALYRLLHTELRVMSAVYVAQQNAPTLLWHAITIFDQTVRRLLSVCTADLNIPTSRSPFN